MSTDKKLTHDDLVRLAEKWARRQRYKVVLRDVRTWATREQPDVIAWRCTASSIVIECKTSRADFLRDASKYFRRNPAAGMGYERYFLVSKAFIVPEELPAGWGLMVVGNRHAITVEKKSRSFTDRAEHEERALLVSAVRRVTEGWGRQMFGDNAPLGADGDAHPRSSRIIRDLRVENTRLRREVRELQLALNRSNG